MSSINSTDFINYLYTQNYTLWNVSEKKMPVLPKGISWSKACNEEIKPNVNLNSSSFGIRTGKQDNEKFIIGLDFDIMVKDGEDYIVDNNTTKLYKKFIELNPEQAGVFISSTENNRGCLVDITDCKDLIELLINIKKSKFNKDNFHLEICNGFNYCIPPTKTVCKVRGKAIQERAFLGNEYFLELIENTPIYDFLYNYINDCFTSKRIDNKLLKKYNKDYNYYNIIDDIENGEIEPMPIEYIEPFINMIDKERNTNYDYWRNVGLSIKNICNTQQGLDLFHSFSKYDNLYNENSVNYKWNIWNNCINTYKGLNHHYILKLARIDNPDKFYYEYINYQISQKDNEYLNKLELFQKEVKYILHPPIYLSYIKHINSYEIYKKEDLIGVYKLKYGKDFILKYINDDNINRIQYFDNMDFIPDLNYKPQEGVKVYNMFDGFYINKIEEPERKGSIDKILLHIKNLCNNDKGAIEILEQWLSHLMFNTCKNKDRISIVIQSQQGAGKGTFYNLVRRMIGEKYCFMTARPEKDVLGQFNGSIYKKVFININEANFKSFDKATMDNFKSMITDDTYIMEKKGKDQLTLSNYMWFLITTNNEKIFNIKADDRRFYFIKANDTQKCDDVYFTELYNEIDNDESIYSFYKYLESIYNPEYKFEKKKQEYKTDYQKSLEQTSKNPFYTMLNEWFDDTIETDKLEEYKEDNPDIIYIKQTEIRNKYKTYCIENDIENHENGESIKRKFLVYDINCYNKYNVRGARTNYYKIDYKAFIKFMRDSNHI